MTDTDSGPLLDTARLPERQAFGRAVRQWISPGPVVDGYLRSTARVKALQGPIGSGKTGGWIGGITINAMRQPVWPDGVRRHRVVVLRDDYRKLWGNLLPTWFTWHADKAPYTEWSGTKDGPADHKLYLQTATGKCILHVMFRAIGNLRTADDIVSFFRGFEAGDIVMEEGDTLAREVFSEAVTRLGRHPPMYVGEPINPTLFIVMNAPLIGSWPHEFIVSNRWKPGIQYFRQPGAYDPGAENRHNLRPGYYEDILENSDQRTIDRVVHNKFVLPRRGQPVYPDYVDHVHCATIVLRPEPGLVLNLGIDAGGSPAAALAQRRIDTQWRVLNEICSDPGTGAERFARAINQMLSLPDYAPWQNRRNDINARCDPSAVFGADKIEGELDWMAKVARYTGIAIRPARSNRKKPRREAIRGPLNHSIDRTTPGFLLSPACAVIRAGLGGMYFYGEVKLGDGRFTEEPIKDRYSHPIDALEYALMEQGGFEEAVGRVGQGMRQPAGPRQIQAITDRNPDGTYERESSPWSPASPGRQSVAR